jgi:hypothetical protein
MSDTRTVNIKLTSSDGSSSKVTSIPYPDDAEFHVLLSAAYAMACALDKAAISTSWMFEIGRAQNDVLKHYTILMPVPEGYEFDPDGPVRALCGLPVRVIEAADYFAVVLRTADQ